MEPPCSRATAATRLSPKPLPGLRAALLQAHEALQGALAVLRRDAGAAIGDGDLDRVAGARERDDDAAAGRAVAPRARLSSTEYLMALSTRLATAWLDELAVGERVQALLGVDIEAQARLLGDRLVELGDVGDDRGGIERLHALGHRAGFQAGDQQQRVEGLDQLVGLLDGLDEAVAVGGRVVRARAAPPRRDCAGG